MGICLFKTEVSNYKLQKSNLEFKLMQNMQRLDDIKEELDRNESNANAIDSARAMESAKNSIDYYGTYKGKTAVDEMHDTVRYKKLFAEEQELDFENESIDTELTYINEMIDAFDKGKENGIKNSGLWCYGG